MNNFIDILLEGNIKSASGKNAQEIFSELLDAIEEEANILKESNLIRKSNNEFLKKRNELDNKDTLFRESQIKEVELFNEVGNLLRKEQLENTLVNLQKSSNKDLSFIKIKLNNLKEE